jgi:hypothetical protein
MIISVSLTLDLTLSQSPNRSTCNNALAIPGPFLIAADDPFLDVEVGEIIPFAREMRLGVCVRE